MPNGDDKNVVRLTMTLQWYRQKFGVWPTNLVLSRDVWRIGVRPYITAAASAALETRLNLALFDGDDATFRAEGAEGSLDYRQIDYGSLKGAPPLSECLGDAWRHPIEPGTTHEPGLNP